MQGLIPIIVQARTGSTRCPAKVMRAVAGRRLIDYTLDALEHCRTARPLIVATSDDPLDDALAAHCTARSTPVVRGPLLDVAARFAEVLARFPVEAFVRISGDSPLIDHRLVDSAVSLFRESQPDLVSNIVQRTFPKGQSVEVIRAATFLDALPQMTSAADREHVTPLFYRDEGRYRIAALTAEDDAGQTSMVVDTEDEFQRFRNLAHQLPDPTWRYHWHDLAPKMRESQ